MLRRGRVYWARLPGDKRRPVPVLMLSPAARNDHASDVIVAPLSTVVRDGPWHVKLRKGEGGVSHPSIIKCEQITTLRKAIVDETPLGKPISGAKMRQVERGVLRAIGVPVPG